MENKKNVVMRYMAALCMLLGCFMYGTGCRNEPAEPKEKIESIEFDKERVVIAMAILPSRTTYSQREYAMLTAIHSKT